MTAESSWAHKALVRWPRASELALHKAPSASKGPESESQGPQIESQGPKRDAAAAGGARG